MIYGRCAALGAVRDAAVRGSFLSGAAVLSCGFVWLFGVCFFGTNKCLDRQFIPLLLLLFGRVSGRRFSAAKGFGEGDVRS